MAAGHARGPPWSWLHDPLTPFALDAVAGVLTGMVWRTRGIGAGAAVLVMGGVVVALYARVITLWELRGGQDSSRLLLGLLTDFVLSTLYILIVAALTYLGLRFRSP